MVAIAYNQPDPEYRREPGENQSQLKHILVSPAHYQSSKKRRFAATISMEMGSAVHCKVLEGDKEFERRYVMKPDDIKLNTKEGIEWKASVKYKTVLSNSDKEKAWDSVLGMSDALRELEWFNPDQPDYRKFNELSIYWEAQGIECKGRLDRLVVNEDYVHVLDLKTTDSVNPKTFEKKVSGDMNYIFQAAWYAEAASVAFGKPALFTFVAIERGAPWSVGIFDVSEEMMAEGNAQIHQAREILRECRKTDTWPKPELNRFSLELPRWYSSPLGTATMETEEAFSPLF
jgi:hypothetical protein